ncbi:MAG: hypothetical protein ACK414_16110, partial [Gemmobacter sp.]
IFASLAAPVLFSTILEYPILVVAAVLCRPGMGAALARLGWQRATLAAAALAGASRHPLAQALAGAVSVRAAEGAVEHDGLGVEQKMADGRWRRLGSARFLGVDARMADDKMELWFGAEGDAPVRLTFSDLPHADAAAMV